MNPKADTQEAKLMRHKTEKPKLNYQDNRKILGLKQSTTKNRGQLKHRKNRNQKSKNMSGDQRHGRKRRGAGGGHHTKHIHQTDKACREDKDYIHRH